MLYENEIKEEVLNALQDEVLSTACRVEGLASDGYIPNKYKLTKLSWLSVLIDAYENIDVFSEEQQNNIDEIYNKVLQL